MALLHAVILYHHVFGGWPQARALEVHAPRAEGRSEQTRKSDPDPASAQAIDLAVNASQN